MPDINPTDSRLSLRVPAIALILMAGNASPALAIQTHGYPGLHVHQIAHILFLAAMISFALRLRASGLTAQPAWRWMALGAWLFGAWNVWTFVGHFITLSIPSRNLMVLEGDLAPSLRLETWKEVAYYFLRMDHLISVPAIFFFYLGIRAVRESFPQRKTARERRRLQSHEEQREMDRRII
jgi:hypothetical protein